MDDVVIELKFPLKELNWRHPILLAATMLLYMKDVDMVLRVAYGETMLNVLTLDVMRDPAGASEPVMYVVM